MTNVLPADVRHALRMFRKSPRFTLTALAALAIGIGGNTAIFSVVNTVLLKPLHIPEPERLLVLGTTSSDGTSVSPAEFMHWRAESSIFQDVSAYQESAVNYTGGEAAEQWRFTRASADLFRCFGISVIEGRAFTAQEDAPHGAPVALISRSLSRRRFASDSKILGKSISLNGVGHTIIGIVADSAGLHAYGPFSDVYVPLQIDPQTKDEGDIMNVAARLKPGITLQQARARLQVSTAEYRAKFPTALAPKQSFTAKPLREDLVGDDRPLLLVLSGAVGLVLLIACTNVANLLLIRASGRRQEMAIRVALGAGRGRVMRQLLTESVLLSLAGGALGLLVGQWGIRALLAVNTAGLSMVGENGAAVTLDWPVTVFALGISLASGVAFGLLPALQVSRADPDAALKSGGRAGRGVGHNRARSVLVAGEVGLALVLLAGSALLIRSFAALYRVDLGFDATNVVTMNVLLTGPRYSKAAAAAETVRTGLERVRSLPGVAAAGATCCLPLAQGTFDLNFDIIGRPEALTAGQEVGWATVSPGYFDVFRIPVKRGRAFTSADDKKSPAVVVIDERMAHEFWKNGDALGARIVIGRGGGGGQFNDEPVRQIVGIVGDIRSEALDAKPRSIMYVPQAQLPDATNAFVSGLLPMAWVIRTRGEPGRLMAQAQIQKQLGRATGVPVTDVTSMQKVVWEQSGRQRFGMLLMSVFGGAALLLATIGIYGLMAYAVEQRRHEIGIRLALGAEPRAVRNMLVGQSMRSVVAGLIGGLGAAWVLARLLSSFLFGVGPHDPVVFVIVPVTLTMVGLAAAYLPSRRVSRLSLMDSIRYE